VLSGNACAYKTDQEGKKDFLNYYQEGDYFGELALL